MSNLRARLQKLLVENEGIMDNQPSDDLYMEWAELAKAVSDTMDGFNNVLRAGKACRDAQKAYFAARKAGLSGHKELEDSKKAEKILDNLVKLWTDEMTAPDTMQLGLF